MAVIAPVVSSSQSLITPGYPMVSVAHSNPVSTVAGKESPTVKKDTIASATHEISRVQSGHSNDRTT